MLLTRSDFTPTLLCLQGGLGGFSLLQGRNFERMCQVASTGIVLALLKVVSRRVGFEIDGIIDRFVGPQASDGDHSIVNLAQLAQVLPADMSRLVAIFAIPGLIDDQNPLGRRGGCRILAQPLESAFLYLALIPVLCWLLLTSVQEMGLFCPRERAYLPQPY